MVMVVWCLEWTANAAICSYASGVATTSTDAAANPTSQGWDFNGGTGAYSSTAGGWRTVDGTGGDYGFYSKALSAGDLALMGNKWDLTITLKPDSFYDLPPDYLANYYGANPDVRTNGTGIQITAGVGGQAGFGYELYFRGVTTAGLTNLVLYDKGSNSSTTLTTDGSYFDRFHTLILHYDNGVAKLGYNGVLTTVTAYNTQHFDSLYFGELSSAEQGSAVWNSFALTIPEPGMLALLATGFVGLLWRKRK